MRPFSQKSIVSLSFTCLLAVAAAQARGENAPRYWAGNVSLSQPRSIPAAATESAPMPQPLTAPVAAAAPASRRVHQASYTEPIAAPVTKQTRNALDFYGGYAARATLNQMPRRTPIQPAAVGQMSHSGKPFQGVSSTSTVSPYLNLFRDENSESGSAPNYFAFVRPQMEQQETFERQQRELQRLERQLQTRPTVAGAPYQSVGGPARFMDTAQFYGGWRK